MWGRDELMMSMLYVCSDGLKADRLVYYAYMLQNAGAGYLLRYRVRSSGVSCRAVDAMLEDCVAGGLIRRNGHLELTASGESVLANAAIDLESFQKLSWVKGLLDGLDNDELYFACIADMTVYDTLRKRGVDYLAAHRQEVIMAIRNLTVEFDNESFDGALMLSRKVRENVSDRFL